MYQIEPIRRAAPRLGRISKEAWCVPCRKTSFKTRDDARIVARSMSDEHGDAVEAYRCRMGHWHVGHRRY